MDSIKITHNIPIETINLEKNREPSKMSEEDLIWCFGAEIQFKSAPSENILMELEVTLFGFLSDFLGVIDEFSYLNEGDSRIINDPYGSYSLEVSKDGDFFKFVDNFSGQSFQSNANEFRSAYAELVKNCIVDVEEKFPALLENPNYIKMKKRFFGKKGCI
jgi:hypothetical protein